MILSPAQVRTLKKGSEVCDQVEDRLKLLEQIATVAPEYADDVRELRELSDHLRVLCAAGLAAAGE